MSNKGSDAGAGRKAPSPSYTATRSRAVCCGDVGKPADQRAELLRERGMSSPRAWLPTTGVWETKTVRIVQWCVHSVLS